MKSSVANRVPTAAFLQLSDLHLGEDAADTGAADRGKLTLGAIKKYGGLKMQAHDPYIFAMLPSSVRSAARFLGAANDRFDYCFVTGDLSTSASSDRRFEFARKYLCDEVKIDENYLVGLGLGESTLFCIPGNHDKLFESDRPERYLKSFAKLPEPPPYKQEIQIPRSGQQFLIYAIDSNLYEEGNIAIGKIYPSTMAWLAQQFEKTPSDFIKGGGVRILVLHHHPADLKPYRKWNLKTFVKSRFRLELTKLQEGDALLDLCVGNIDLIIHGHEHFPVVFQNSKAQCVVQSAGTACQFSSSGEEQNCFHTLMFFNRKVILSQFNWQKPSFRPSRYWETDLDAKTLTGPTEY